MMRAMAVAFLVSLPTMMTAEASSNFEPAQSPIAGHAIRDSYSIISDLYNGRAIQVRMFVTRGTLVGGETYTVLHRNGTYYVTGYNGGTKKIGTWAYSNANLHMHEISLWGRKFILRTDGTLEQINNGQVEAVVTYTPNGSDRVIRELQLGHPVQFRMITRRGSLAHGETYTVLFRDGVFHTTGRNGENGAIGTWSYSNANLHQGRISLWGAVFTVGYRGELISAATGRLEAVLAR